MQQKIGSTEQVECPVFRHIHWNKDSVSRTYGLHLVFIYLFRKKKKSLSNEITKFWVKPIIASSVYLST